MEIWQMIAREEIRDLVARYNSNADTGRFEQVRQLFAEDAHMDIGDGRQYQGIDQVMTIFTDTQNKTAVSAGLSHVRHCTTTHQIDLKNPTTATGRLYFFVLTDIGLDHWGRYGDTYILVGDQWRFAARTVSVDGWADNSLFPH